MKGYERKALYSIEEVLSKRLPSELGKSKDTLVSFDGDDINMASQRYDVFDEKGTTCVTCGMESLYFEKERHSSGNTKRYHFNLYGKNAEGEEVMFTKDHIVPKSKGGTDELSNYQTMCAHCNRKKGNKNSKTETVQCTN